MRQADDEEGGQQGGGEEGHCRSGAGVEVGRHGSNRVGPDEVGMKSVARCLWT